ncbi:MAG: Polysaccharide export outer membrane protein [uncultured Sulfurovum sp.]|uniref:Polysaccharide export outer membrane protein n=1 Tax=uncultured Sulfurovum sp. TaxID=269237 RepID=A0A6S6SJ19_9BACT|nr:MAG: Polysaccharide export outer membrane protein [uncultured Sulfurovum sp.]
MLKLLSILLILYIQGCGFKKDYVLFNQSETLKQTSTSIIHKNVKFEYKIMPHDRISLIVYQHPDLSTTTPSMATQDKGILVDSEGVVSLALLEDVNISGLTQKGAAKKIEQGYDEYLNYAKVRIEVLNKRAYVIGEVKKPGEFPLKNEQLTLLQAIAQAGDFTETANRQQVMIIRSAQNGAKTIIIDLTDVNSITHATLMIKPNDIVYVTPSSMKAINTNISSISPIFGLISNILAPFVSYTYLKNN